MSRVTLSVLAGGRSRRFGTPKSNLSVSGMPILAWLCRRLRPCATHTVLSVGQLWPAPTGAGQFDRIVADHRMDAGPLAAMKSVIDSISIADTFVSNDNDERNDHLVVFVTTDMPLVTACRVNQLARCLHAHERAVGVMNRWVGRGDAAQPGVPAIEPFPSVWRVRPARVLFARALAAGIAAPHRLAGRKDVWTHAVPSTDRWAFANINTPGDLQILDEQCPNLRIAAVHG